MRALILLVLASWIAGFSYGAEDIARANPQTPDGEFKKAMELLRDKKYPEARLHFQRATQLNPRSPQAFFYLGMSALHMGDRAAAEVALRRSLKLDPAAVNALYNLGVVLLDDKKSLEASKYFEKARQGGPLSPELAINLTRAYLEAGRTDRAVTVAETAVPQFSGSVEFDLILGKLFLAHGVGGPACSTLHAADRLRPRDPGIALPLAAACLENKDVDSVRAALASIQDKASDSAQYHSLAAKVRFLSGEKEAALEEMNSAVQLSPRDPVLLLTLGRLYQKCGEQQKAVSILEKAAALDSQTPEIPYSLAVSYITADNETAAIEFANRALRLDPNFDRALFLLGSIHLAFDRLDEAEKALTQALRLQPQNSFYHCFFGMLLAAQNRLSEAQKQFEQALAIRPSYALVHFHLGRLLQKRGDNAKAEAELENAIALAPGMAEAYYQLGVLLNKRGEHEKSDLALARFKALRDADYSERDAILKQLQDTVR